MTPLVLWSAEIWNKWGIETSGYLVKSIQGGGNSYCKGPAVGWNWHYLRNGENMRKTESIGQENYWLNWLPKIRSSINLDKCIIFALCDYLKCHQTVIFRNDARYTSMNSDFHHSAYHIFSQYSKTLSFLVYMCGLRRIIDEEINGQLKESSQE